MLRLWSWMNYSLNPVLNPQPRTVDSMGGHISQKWYEFTTGDQEIDRYGWVYRLVIEIVDRYGWDYRLLIENDGRYGPKSDWILRLTIAIVEKKIGVWKRSSTDWRSGTPTAMIEKSTCNWEMKRPGNKRGIVHVFLHEEVSQEFTFWSKAIPCCFGFFSRLLSNAFSDFGSVGRKRKKKKIKK